MPKSGTSLPRPRVKGYAKSHAIITKGGTDVFKGRINVVNRLIYAHIITKHHLGHEGETQSEAIERVNTYSDAALHTAVSAPSTPVIIWKLIRISLSTLTVSVCR